MLHKLKDIGLRIVEGLKYLLRPETIAASVVAVTVVAVTINTSGVILQNYRLERDVKIMEQKVELAKIELETQRSKNQYYATDYYMDIAARKLLGRGAPGEKLIIVPREVALRELPATPATEEGEQATQVGQSSNFQQWLEFLSGKLD